MFEDFLYLLRRYGLKVSLTEWMTLMEALDKGLHNSSFTGFYYLCRCLLVKSEADFDRFDRAFLEYFKNVPFQQEVSQELLDWLNRPDTLLDHANWDEEQALKNLGLSEDEIERMLRERMAEQNEEHNGGSYWVGTHGMSTFGNSGLSPTGIRVGGESKYKRAFRVAGERRFRDFRGTTPWTPASSRWPSARCGSCLRRSGAPKRSWMWTPRSTTPARARGGWRSGTRTPGRTR